MRVFVTLAYTVALEVDAEQYGAETVRQLVEAINGDSDFAMDHLSNGPHRVHDVDWWPADPDDFASLEDQRDDWELVVTYKPASRRAAPSQPEGNDQ